MDKIVVGEIEVIEEKEDILNKRKNFAIFDKDVDCILLEFYLNNDKDMDTIVNTIYYNDIFIPEGIERAIKYLTKKVKKRREYAENMNIYITKKLYDYLTTGIYEEDECLEETYFNIEQENDDYDE